MQEDIKCIDFHVAFFDGATAKCHCGLRILQGSLQECQVGLTVAQNFLLPFESELQLLQSAAQGVKAIVLAEQLLVSAPLRIDFAPSFRLCASIAYPGGGITATPARAPGVNAPWTSMQSVMHRPT